MNRTSDVSANFGAGFRYGAVYLPMYIEAEFYCCRTDFTAASFESIIARSIVPTRDRNCNTTNQIIEF